MLYIPLTYHVSNTHPVLLPCDTHVVVGVDPSYRAIAVTAGALWHPQAK